MRLVLKDLTLINPEQNLNEKSDLLIVDGKIEKVGNLTKDDLSGAEVYEMNGKYCSPGFFDMHIHLREPGREDKETVVTGSNSAAAGGFTGVACMPNTDPCTDSAEVVRYILDKAKDHLVDVYPIGAATVGRKGESLAPVAEMKDAGAVAFSDDGVAIKTAAILRNVMEYTSMYDLPVIEHCEDESLADGYMNEGEVSTFMGVAGVPTIAEDLTVVRDVMMAEYTNSRVHIAHISSKKAVEIVRLGKSKGIKVTAEVAPHHFTLTEESLKTFDTNYRMNPPLRTSEDVEAMIEGLKDGTIDCIASDHAPHTIEEKEVEFIYAPNGIVGLETQLGISFTELYHKKHLTMDQMIEKLSINPRKILNVEVPKIAAGEKANLTIFDPDEIWTVDLSKTKSKSKNSPFDKRLLTGKPIASINNSQIYIDGKFSKI